MESSNDNAHAIGEILNDLEVSAREVRRSLDSRNRVDRERLARVRDTLGRTLEAVDRLLVGED